MIDYNITSCNDHGVRLIDKMMDIYKNFTEIFIDVFMPRQFRKIIHLQIRLSLGSSIITQYWMNEYIFMIAGIYLMHKKERTGAFYYGWVSIRGYVEPALSRVTIARSFLGKRRVWKHESDNVG